jgi:uncharacterized protein (TIGR00255 family)
MISMSGYGEARGEVDGATVEVVIRSVNARFLDVRVTAPEHLAGLQARLQHELTKRFSRGKIDVRLRVRRGAEGATACYDPQLLARTLDALSEVDEARKRFLVSRGQSSQGVISLGDLTAVKEAFWSASSAEPWDLSEAGVRALVDQAARAHQEMARREGEATRAHVAECAAGIRAQVARFEARALEGAPIRRQRLYDRLYDLLASVEGVDPEDVDARRVEQEILQQVERADVSEELARLAAHLDSLDRLLADAVDTPKGKKLEYLAVEIHRELNTSASKNALPEAAEPLVEARLHNERIREQAANVI